MRKTLAILIFLFVFLPKATDASLQKVIINEIAWMGTESSYNDEWIELYNGSSFNLSLEGWQLIAEDGSPIINLSGEITAGDFYLLERTDDETVPDVKADLIYKGSLNNEGEYLRLVDKDGLLIDEVNCLSGWFAGDNKTKATMEREETSEDPLQNWQKSQAPGGTPKAKNSQGKILLEEKEQREKSAGYPSNIFINEILPSPEGPDNENEWIEISNQNGFKVSLSNWKIADSVGSPGIYIFNKDAIIEANSFLVLFRPSTKIILNNDEDALKFLKPNNSIADEVVYKKAPLGKSFNRTESGWFWSSSLTPGATNIVSLPEEKTQDEDQEETVSLGGKASLNPKEWKETASIINLAGNSARSSLAVLLTALTVSLFSGTIILLIKNRFLKK